MGAERPAWATPENLYGRYARTDSSEVRGIAWYIAETYRLHRSFRTQKRGDASVTYVSKGPGGQASWLYEKGLGADQWFVEQDPLAPPAERYLLYCSPANRVSSLLGFPPNNDAYIQDQ